MKHQAAMIAPKETGALIDHFRATSHEAHRAALATLVPLPGHACGSWRALRSGTVTLPEELATQAALENDVRFPRFEREP